VRADLRAGLAGRAAPQVAPTGRRPPRCGVRAVRPCTARWCRQSRGRVCAHGRRKRL